MLVRVQPSGVAGGRLMARTPAVIHALTIERGVKSQRLPRKRSQEGQLACRRGTVLRVAPNDLGVGSTPTCGANRRKLSVRIWPLPFTQIRVKRVV